MNKYLKIGKAGELEGGDYKFYRFLEILPGLLSWLTLLGLLFFSYLKPIYVAYFIIAFDVYWLLLVLYLGIHLFVAYRKMKENLKINWNEKIEKLDREKNLKDFPSDSLIRKGFKKKDIIHLIIFPFSFEGLDIIRPSVQSVVDDGYPTDKMILVLGTEARAGEDGKRRAEVIKKEYENIFKKIIITSHPDGIEGELKCKGSNQAWAAREVKKRYIDKEKLDYNKILVSVFDMDTIVSSGYFACLTYMFLTVKNPYRASYQPIPVYHNNIWEARFFARVAAASNTFWQMMQQIRQEKLATYSSHSMTWRALTDINFWSTTMVSEDSRIFWHCFLHYKGDYRVEPMHFPVSMDITDDKSFWHTAKSLYKQQRRWGWGVENLPYLLFNTIKGWKFLPKRKMISRILVQIYGFHSWATNALIIGVIGWMPIILGGSEFNSLVLSGNLPSITRTLMMIAMIGLVFSAIISTLLLPKKPKKYNFGKTIIMLLQWLLLPFSIIVFGAIPGLEAQTRLMLGGKYRLGFQVTPKGRAVQENVNWDNK
jgi:hypothetical protein